VIAVDSSALIAILRREPEAERSIDIIAAAHKCLLSSVGLLETSMVLAGRIAGSAAWARLDAFIQDAGMTVVPHNAARDASLRFGTGRHPAALNMGDCAAYALAKQANAPLLFKGNDFSRTDIVAAR
jgi:ribonuclease VapC